MNIEIQLPEAYSDKELNELYEKMEKHFKKGELTSEQFVSLEVHLASELGHVKGFNECLDIVKELNDASNK